MGVYVGGYTPCRAGPASIARFVRKLMDAGEAAVAECSPQHTYIRTLLRFFSDRRL